MNICDNIAVLKVLYFIKTLLDIVLFIVPIGLIVIIMVDFAKSVIAGKEDEMRKNTSIVIKRIIYCVALFLIPTIVEFAINGLGNFRVEYKSCFNITMEEIKRKEQEQKAKCTGDEYEWNDTLYICEKKSTSEGNNTNTTINTNTTNDIKKFKYYNQLSPEWENVPLCGSDKTIGSSGCGATSLAVVASTLSDPKYTPKEVANWLCNNGHTGGAVPWSFFTKQSMLDKFGLEAEVLFKNGNEGQKDVGRKYSTKNGEALLNAVNQGKGVILHIPQHYVVVGKHSDCSQDEVYLYDVAINRFNGCYTPYELFTETYNYQKRCTNEGSCGWRIAFAYNKK